MRNAANTAAQATQTHTHPYTQLPRPHITPRPVSAPLAPALPCLGPSIVGKSIDMCRCAAFGRLQIANQSINNWNENHFAGFNLSSPATALVPPSATPLLLRYASFWLRMQMGKIVYIYHSDRIGISIESGRHTHRQAGREKGWESARLSRECVTRCAGLVMRQLMPYVPASLHASVCVCVRECDNFQCDLFGNAIFSKLWLVFTIHVRFNWIAGNVNQIRNRLNFVNLWV